MTAQTFSPDPSGPPEYDLSGMIRTLEAAGYTVRKARKAADTLHGARLCKAPKGHDRCAAHYKVDGYRKPVCIAAAGTVREDGRDTGQPIGPEWTDPQTVLAFALSMAAARPDPAARHDREWWDQWHTDREAAMKAAREDVAA